MFRLDSPHPRSLTAVAFTITALVLTGCAASGVKVNQADLLTFQPGVATCTQVLERFGPPTSSTVTSQGTKRFVYAYQQSQIDPKALIPFYGRAYTMEHTQTVIDCDRDDVVQGYTSEQGQDKAGTGLGGGARQR
jgi:hypothetical protein